MRTFCCSFCRAYRTIGEASNRSKILTKSIRSFRWMCPCNKRKPLTAVFDSQSGYLGKVEFLSSIGSPCGMVSMKLYDHKDQHCYSINFPRMNLIGCFGMYPWQQYDKFDIKVSKVTDNSPVALVRRQWSNASKELCSNGTHYFIKFKQLGLRWHHKQLIFESIIMLDMCQFNNRSVCSREICFLLSVGLLACLVFIFYGIFSLITF